MSTNRGYGGVTSRHVAQRAGVSQPTVSRVLAGHPYVRQAVRDKVMAAIRELDYRPNGNALAMRTNRTGNIGVVVSRLANPLYPELLQILGRTLIRAGFRMVVWNTEEMDEQAAIDAVRESRVDGVIMTTATVASTRLYDALQMNAPVVLINRVVEGWPCDQVASDNLDGGRMVAEYFLRSNRRRIGMIQGPVAASTIRDRQTGFQQALMEQGGVLDQSVCTSVEEFSYKQGFDATCRLLELPEPPDALFCVNDIIALGAIDAARNKGIDIPEQLWIVGYDDIEMASWKAFDLTTVRQPMIKMSEGAIDLLLERINGYEGEPRIVCLSEEFVVRGSSGPLLN
ncbi:MAG: transcriptional regulator, LacI family [Pseudomonas sp.]|nr:transcriptional regulator, LacI family [Pseudomonas sp.]